MKDLKLYCEDSIVLKADNVVDKFRYAELYNAKSLKAKCLDFMATNFQQTTHTEGWKRLCISPTCESIYEVTKSIANIQAAKKNS